MKKIHQKNKHSKKISLIISVLIITFLCNACQIKKIEDKAKHNSEISSIEISTESKKISSQSSEEYPIQKNNKADYLRWQEDLKQLKHDITWYNTGPFQKFGKESFDSMYQEIFDEIPNLNNYQREYRFRELVSSIGDGHIDMWTENESDYSLPIMIDEFEDGFFVINAISKYQDMIGEKVETINGVKVEDIISKLEKISNFENKYWRRQQAINKAHYAYFYKLLEMQNDEDEVVTVNKTNLDCIYMTRLSFFNEWVKPIRVGNITNDLMMNYLIYDEPYSYQFIESNKILYVRFSSCYYEIDDYLLKDFGQDILQETLRKKPQFLIIDLRDNGGGRTSQLYAALSENFFKASCFINNPKFFVAINNNTFSAAVINSYVLKNKFGATLIGSPTGGSPFTTCVTDTSNKILKNSKINFRISSAKMGKKMIDSPSQIPDITLSKKSQDLNEDKDPVIEYVKLLIKKQK